MQYFLNIEGAKIISDVVEAVKSNRAYLGEIDGEIGDGDHGVNMHKGFTVAGNLIDNTHNFSYACKTVGDVLMHQIGGSMGPLYGSMFRCFFTETREKEQITLDVLCKMLETSLKKIMELGKAEVGDKTMVDTLYPAVNAIRVSAERNEDLKTALISSLDRAREGRDSTKEMIARVGRSARLGERSKGVLDAGAVSCYIILESMYKSIIDIMLSD